MSTVTAPLPGVQASPRSSSVLLDLLLWGFSITLFVSATILFVVQPLFAKMVLPLLGGTPAVWNTCLVFYQAALLLGYTYSHLVSRYLAPRRQVLVHLAVLFLPWLVLPIRIAGWGTPAGEENPIGWLLGLLCVCVGLPFFVVSTSAPLLQRWFALTGHPQARDPYFLYASSNAGSMLALLAYPFVIEPNLSLAQQSWLWAAAYALLILLVMGCAILFQFAPATQAQVEKQSEAPPSWLLRLRWVALGLVPSSLLVGVTTHLTTDVAAIPLLWVLPLAAYLLTFIVVFSSLGPRLHPVVVGLVPMVLILVLGQKLTELSMPLLLLLGMHLLAFFLIALVCHGELARTRPGALHLTEFFLLMSLGGVLGGLFNALVAPLAFDRNLEYPIVLALACLLMPCLAHSPSPGWRWGYAIAAGLSAALYAWGWYGSDPVALAALLGTGAMLLLRLGTALVPLALAYAASPRPAAFALATAGVLAASVALADPQGRVLTRARGFFGYVAVHHDPERNTNWLVHGTTLHGKQSQEAGRRQEPLTYFHRTGPMGQLFRTLGPARDRVGVTGLGMGTLACYALPGQQWTFYEIDPVVTRLAEDERYFSCLADARRRGVRLDVILGDARLRLAEAPESGYDLLILDSFSSDSVPVHLISHEAVRLYLAKLAADGVMVFNISNKYLDLEPVLARVAREEGLIALVQLDYSELDTHPDKLPSRWVVMARRANLLAPLRGVGNWSEVKIREDVKLWRDDFSNLFRVFMWSGE